MAGPRVSVIMIFLDPGKFFEEATDSVLGQSYGDLELILVDDGSADGSSEVARRAAAEHRDRISYVEHPGHANHGTGPSRNLGLQHARGELVAFLDADDVWVPNAVERQVELLDAHPEAAMTIGATRYWYSWSPDGGPDHCHRVGVSGVVSPPRLARMLLHRRIGVPSLTATMARRSAIAAVGGFEDSFRSHYEDQAFHFKFFLVHPVLVHDEVIDLYRQHPDSTVATGLATGFYHPLDPSPARLAYRQFVVRHLRSGPFRGSRLHREAVWLLKVDRWPRVGRYIYKLRPPLVTRVRNRLSPPSAMTRGFIP